MSLLSSFFQGKKKPNLTPDITIKTPQQVNPEAYGNLKTLANNYINNNGTGYGEDYVNKNTNPVAAAARRNYTQFTAPATASAYSARGLGRSSLAANELGRQEGDVESGINQTMAQFYNLNEQAKKNDVNTGINVSNSLLSGDVANQEEQAAASERLNSRTAAQENAIQDANQAKTGQFIQAGAQLVAPMLNGVVPGLGTTVSGAAGSTNNQPTSSNVQILGKMNSQQLQSLSDEDLIAFIRGK